MIRGQYLQVQLFSGSQICVNGSDHICHQLPPPCYRCTNAKHVPKDCNGVPNKKPSQDLPAILVNARAAKPNSGPMLLVGCAPCRQGWARQAVVVTSSASVLPPYQLVPNLPIESSMIKAVTRRHLLTASPDWERTSDRDIRSP